MRNIRFYLVDAEKIRIKLEDQSKYPSGIPAFLVGKDEKDLRSGKHIALGVSSENTKAELKKFIEESLK